MRTDHSVKLSKMKYKILHLVFRNKSKAEGDIGLSAKRKQQHHLQYQKSSTSDASLEETIVTPHTPYQKQLNGLPECDRQITTQDFNDLFSDTIELTYDRIDNTKRRKRTLVSKVIAPNATSFLDLPREIRNEIYRYAVTSDEVWKIRPRSIRKDSADIKKTREQFPKLYSARLPFGNEVLEIHYRHNTLRFSSVHDHGPDNLLNWIESRGLALVKHVRHMQVTYRLHVEVAYAPLGVLYDLKTSIKTRPDGTLEVSTEQIRPTDACYCGIAELVQERLLREDAQSDATCMKRISMTTQSGPVLGFALQLLEAVRLSQTHHDSLVHLSTAEKTKYHGDLPADCILCGKRKWFWRL